MFVPIPLKTKNRGKDESSSPPISSTLRSPQLNLSRQHLKPFTPVILTFIVNTNIATSISCPSWLLVRQGLSYRLQLLTPTTNGLYRFNQKVLVDPTPMPSHIPPVDEIGATSAPLLSASYFIGAKCQPYNDDYMQCKTEAHGRGELECLKEGRKVTRCAASVYVFPTTGRSARNKEQEISLDISLRNSVQQC